MANLVRLALALFGFFVILIAQTSTNNKGTTTVTYTSVGHTLPIQTGAATNKPGTCDPGELYFASDATAGQNLYMCTAGNTWTQQLNDGSQGKTISSGTFANLPATCTHTSTQSDLYFFNDTNPSYAEAVCTATNTWTYFLNSGAITPPPASGWSWQGQNPGGSTNTITTSSGPFIMTSNGAGDGIASYVRNEIASTFTIKGCFNHTTAGFTDGSTHYASSGLVVTDGTKLILYMFMAYNGTAGLWAFHWTNNTTVSTVVTGFGGASSPIPYSFVSPLLCIGIQETVSARNYLLAPSPQGPWQTVSSTANNDFLTTTKYGMHIRANNVSAVGVMYSFTETNP